MLIVRFFGAAGCVTGACFLIETERAQVLVDCGLFQGPKTLKALNYGAFPFDPRRVHSLVLTHAHVDHSGLIPKLVLAGFNGPIFATRATVELSRILLADAGAIQEMEVEALNRRRRRHGEDEVSPIFTRRDAEAALSQFDVVPMKTWRTVAPGVRARWWDAGHILGSASIELEVTADDSKQRLLFSGDIGPGGRDFTADPEGPKGIDHLIVESTYGDRERPSIDADERRRVLAQETCEAHAAGGPLLIPAFAVERTQELIVDLLTVMEANEAPPGPIFLDSPLAIQASETFLELGRDGSGANPFARLQESGFLRYTETASESRAIERMRGWHVIIAASGMCDAGRVRHHLKRLLWRSEATLLLTGYQAIGTLGRLLQEGRDAVRIQGDEVKVRARIRTIDVYSGHADASGLMQWVDAREPIGGAIFLTHGEPESLDGFKRRLENAGRNADRVVIAHLDASYRLYQDGRVERLPGAPRLDPAAPARLDWHNLRSEFMARLSRRLNEAGSDEERETLLSTLLQSIDDGQSGDSRS